MGDDAILTETNLGTDRGLVIGRMFASSSRWSLRFLIIVAALFVIGVMVGQLWVGVFPIVMAIIVSTVMWPAVRFLRTKGWPAGVAAAVTMLVFVVGLVGVFSVIAPQVVGQAQEVVDSAAEGIEQVQNWFAGPPFNIQNEQLTNASDQVVEWLQGSAGGIASGVLSGVSAVGTGVINLFLILVLTFFFLKDGQNFLPWVRRISGRRAGAHLTEVFARIYRTISGFIRTQALVGLIDAVMIGAGLAILGVPLVFALAVLTFFAAFIPIVGAVVAGAFAVLVALVTTGWQTALIVLAIVLAVQQIEGNLLLPVLQSKSMDLHAGIVLIGITAGGTLFGIVGAFLAVPVAASLVVTLRYFSEQIDLQTGDLSADELAVVTPYGKSVAAAEEAELEQSKLSAQQQSTDSDEEDKTPRKRRFWTRRGGK